MGGRVVICSGFDYDSNEATKDCFYFADNDDNDGSANDGDEGIGKWTKTNARLAFDRGDSASAKMDDNRFWITGEMWKTVHVMYALFGYLTYCTVHTDTVHYFVMNFQVAFQMVMT